MSPSVHNMRDFQGRVYPDGVEYVGRPSKWGNPFSIGEHGSRAEVIQKYRDWLARNPDLMEEIEELRGKDLMCWCYPAPCHADVLLELANDG